MESSRESESSKISSGWFEATHSEQSSWTNGGDSAQKAFATEHIVLIIDDDDASGAFARAVLEESGYRVFLATSGAEGLALFGRVRPHCVLLDARMPILDGYETCRQLRSLSEGTAVPVVFMTAERNVDSFDRAFACGADDFLTKPVSPQDLIDRVRAGLALWRVRTSHDYSLVKGQRDRLLRHQLQQERLNLLLVHDLKSPLNAISLLAQGMLRGKSLNGPNREMLEEIWQQARNMAGMVVDLLDIGKAREGKLTAHVETIDLRDLLDQVLLGFQAIAHSREIELQPSVFVRSLAADQKLLKRLLANIIDNALQHAPRGSTIQIVASPRPGHTELRVADAGPGIPDQLRDCIFDAFSQEVSANNDHRGLGLTFCRLAAEAHGGRIWVEDGAPGCVMCVAIP